MDLNFIHRILSSLTSKDSVASRSQTAVDIQAAQPLPEASYDRRIDARFALRTRCLYELVDGRDEHATSPPGEAFSLNLSSDGILLLLDRKPQDRQLVAMRNPALRQRTVTLFEVRWLRRLPVGTTHQRYMVGCHLTFGRFPYFLVQRQHFDQHLSGLSL